MNPLTNVKNITKLNEIELASGSIHKKSWHDMYKESAWIFIGGLEYGLTEGDVITVFSQYGEIVNINLVRDKKTGKSKGFCFLCYANQKSTVLAVDNLNAIKLCNRTIRVDHVANYKPPKEDDRDDEITKMLKSDGCAPKEFQTDESNMASMNQVKKKKIKKEKKEKKKKKRKHSSSERDSGNKISSIMDKIIKTEKHDPGYDKYDTSVNKSYDNEGKQKEPERSHKHSLGESSHSRERVKSRSDHVSNERDCSQSEDRFSKKQRPSDTYVSQHKEGHKERDRDSENLLRKNKRERSSFSSSDDNSGNVVGSDRYKHDNVQSKKKHSNSKRRHREHKQTSSSSDDDSSSQSSTDEDKNKNNNRNSKRDKSKYYEEKKSHHEGKQDKSNHRSDSFNYTSDRSRHYEKSERDFEYRSQGKFKSDERDESSYKDSHYRSRCDKR